MEKVIQEMLEKGLVSFEARGLLEKVPVWLASSVEYKLDLLLCSNPIYKN